MHCLIFIHFHNKLSVAFVAKTEINAFPCAIPTFCPFICKKCNFYPPNQVKAFYSPSHTPSLTLYPV